MKIRNVHIDDYKVFRDFNIDFTDNGTAQNLIVLTGINGSGKTTLLKDILLKFLQNQIIESNTIISCEYTDSETKKNILADFSRRTLEDALEFNKSSYLNIEFPKTYFFQAGQSNQHQAKEAILKFADKLIYQQDKKSSEAYEQIQKLLNDLFLDFELQIEFRGINQEREILFRNVNYEQISINELSSGEQELITKVFTLHLAEIRNSIILVDEPEGSMHPSWQSRIAQIYQKLADQNNNQVFLATHSPHIISSVRKEQIRILVKDQENIRVIQNFAGSYGWRIDRILMDIFRLTSLRTPVVEKELQKLKQLCFENQYDTAFFTQKLINLEKILGYDDIDLTLLRFEIIQRKKRNEKN